MVQTFVILALRRLRQEDQEFEASLGCIVRLPSQKKVISVITEDTTEAHAIDSFSKFAVIIP
jgi:hypothetical protein